MSEPPQGWPVGLLFPVTGVAILAMLALDLLLIRTLPPLRRAFA